MATVEAPYSIHQRFARYYLNKLNALASKLDTRSDSAFIEAITLLDEDLEQIRQAIKWLNTLSSQDSELALITLNFLKVNTRLLMLRLTSDELVSYTKTALEAAQQFQDNEAVCQCLYQLALIYRNMDRYDDSMVYLQELLALSQRDADSRHEAMALHLLGTIDNIQSRHVQARQKLEKGLALLKKMGDRSEIYGRVITSLANTYSAEGKHEIAIPLQQEALALFTEQRDLYQICYVLNNLGDDYTGLGRYSEALTIFEDGIRIARTIGHNDSLDFLLGNTGYVHLRLGNLETARTYLEESIAVCKAVDELYGELLFSAFLLHITMTADNPSESYCQLCDLIVLASERKLVSRTLLLLTAVAKWHLLAGNPVQGLQLLDLVSTSPNLRHEWLYFIERVRHEIADVYPDLQSPAPLPQSIDEIVAKIRSDCIPAS